MSLLKIVVIGASEGGVNALKSIIGALPRNLPAAIFVVLHIGPHPSELAHILTVSGGWQASFAKDRETILAGRVYVAPPNHHMIISAGAIKLTKGPRENFARPSIDPLFRSAAEEFGSSVIGVILTGGLNDGTAGLFEIKRRGGLAIVEDPESAANPSMPSSAIRHVSIDFCGRLASLPRLIERAVINTGRLLPPSPPSPGKGQAHNIEAEFTHDRPVAITCPDCGGALRESQLGTLKQYRCHIGHVYTGAVMLDGQFRAMEQAVEAAIRSLNERAEMCRQMAEQAGADHEYAAQWRLSVEEALQQTRPLQALLDHDWHRPSRS